MLVLFFSSQSLVPFISFPHFCQRDQYLFGQDPWAPDWNRIIFSSQKPGEKDKANFLLELESLDQLWQQMK